MGVPISVFMCPSPDSRKKYAKMGFKKGWRAFKAAKRKRARPGTKRRTVAQSPAHL